MHMKRYAIVVAGGAGSRFGGEQPKQFMLLAGRPVLWHALQAFSRATAELVLVLPPGKVGYWRS